MMFIYNIKFIMSCFLGVVVIINIVYTAFLPEKKALILIELLCLFIIILCILAVDIRSDAVELRAETKFNNFLICVYK